MAKTFRKIILGTAVIGAAAAGIHHILNSKDRLDDFDDFDDEINDDLEEFLKEEAENSEREYVPLDLSGEKKVSEDDKIIGKVYNDSDNVVKESDEKHDGAKEFKFTDLSSQSE